MTPTKPFGELAGISEFSADQTSGPRTFSPSSSRRNVKGQMLCQVPPDLYDIRQAAKYLNCSVSSVRRRVKERVLPGFNMNGKIQIEGRDLRRFMEAHRVEANWVGTLGRN
jgi:excisionase family DNA binding protein